MSKLEEKIVDAFRYELSQMILSKLKAEDSQTREKFAEWFMYEFGLDVLFPFIGVKAMTDDAKKWDRIRGSKKALELALEWLGCENAEVETFGSNVNFFRYQIKLKKPPSQSLINKIKGIAKISSAHRDELFRLYIGKYHISNLQLGSCVLGLSMLSDCSGIKENGIKLALKKEHLCK